MHTVRMTIARRRWSAAALRAALFVGCGLVLCACNTDQRIAGVPEVSPDYRLRHPITITEGDRTLQVLIGSNRATLTPMQRGEVLAFAQNWRREATGGVIIDLPTGSSNARASFEALPEIRSILIASGVPPRGVVVRKYATIGGVLGNIRITYPKMIAQAGPCGLWPEDIGPSLNRDYFENQPPWNYGCATQRNLAAMVDNPADLVQPRSETPPNEMRRTTAIGKYQQGQSTATQYPNATAGRISTLGQ